MTSVERYTNVDQEERVFGMLERKVGALIKSNLLPEAVRGKPADALLVAVKGHELGLTFTASFSHLFVVNGKVGESAQLLADQAAAVGYDVYVGDDADAKSATAFVVNRRTGQRHSLTWTIEDAQRAKLTEKKVWKEYPAAMLRARAISNAVRSFCRGLILAADVEPYTPDELGADVVEFEVEERELSPAPAPKATGPIDVPSAPAADKDSGGGTSEEDDASPSEAPAGEPPEDEQRPNVFAKSVHIEAHRVGLTDDELDEIMFSITGAATANGATRDNVEEIVARIRAAKDPAA